MSGPWKARNSVHTTPNPCVILRCLPSQPPVTARQNGRYPSHHRLGASTASFGSSFPPGLKPLQQPPSPRPPPHQRSLSRQSLVDLRTNWNLGTPFGAVIMPTEATWILPFSAPWGTLNSQSAHPNSVLPTLLRCYFEVLPASWLSLVRLALRPAVWKESIASTSLLRAASVASPPPSRVLFSENVVHPLAANCRESLLP